MAGGLVDTLLSTFFITLLGLGGAAVFFSSFSFKTLPLLTALFAYAEGSILLLVADSAFFFNTRGLAGGISFFYDGFIRSIVVAVGFVL